MANGFFFKNVMGKLVPDPSFLKKLKFSISLDQQPEVLCLLLLYAWVEDYQYIETNVLATCVYFI